MRTGPARLREARAQEAEAETISRLISTTLFRSNAADYPMTVLERVAEAHAPSHVLDYLARRDVLVAETEAGEIVGTVAAEAEWLKSFFVHPDWQGRGIGRALLEAALARMTARDIATAWLEASLTGVDFYQTAGFTPMREIIERADRRIVMKKDL
ncbi:GNAT family N-acetyltransferase [Tropicimonas sp. TH_r6]|uniref:GNAT family N-acetyltransferase n=1 Tax=Tropicimonas sp. TH_r6 TaxID=3082085 RepID=UPI002953941D|nr:GNAT family N-acetyltransferase [Tropicimonas sp. TH_r6]MDV7141594.1 GNAT family N-acetyltransferase [Tropicimonas sp. TH_r6]